MHAVRNVSNWSLGIPVLYREMKHTRQPIRNGVILNEAHTIANQKRRNKLSTHDSQSEAASVRNDVHFETQLGPVAKNATSRLPYLAELIETRLFFLSTLVLNLRFFFAIFSMENWTKVKSYSTSSAKEPRHVLWRLDRHPTTCFNDLLMDFTHLAITITMIKEAIPWKVLGQLGVWWGGGGGGGAINYCIRVSTTSKIDDLTCVD